MQTHSGGQRTTNVTDNQAPIEIINGETFPVRIDWIELINGAATACKLELGRPAAKGVTPTTPVAIQDEAEGAGSLSNVTTALAWGTSPTPPTIPMRRIALGAAIGSRVMVEFNDLVLSAGETFVVSNDGTGQVLDINVGVSRA